MRDTFKITKDLLGNFVKFLREREGLPPEEGVDATLEAFLGTQGIEQRFVPCCEHCGSDSVKEGDFKDEMFIDQDAVKRFVMAHGRQPVGEEVPWTKPADPKSAGPAWVCQVASCGSFSPRSAS